MEAEANLSESWRGRISLLAVKDQVEMFTNHLNAVYLDLKTLRGYTET